MESATMQIWRQNEELVFAYLEQECNMAVLSLDLFGKIVHCNRAFLELLHLPAVPKDKPITDFLAPETIEGMSWGNQPAYRMEAWHLKTHVGYYRAQSHIYKGESFYLVFVDKPLLTDSSFIKDYDAINRELSALSRELHKKNAAIESANLMLLEKETILKQAAAMARIGHWRWKRSSGRVDVSSNLCYLWDRDLQNQTMDEAEFLSYVVREDITMFRTWLDELKTTGRSGEIKYRYYGANRVEKFGHCMADVLDETGDQEQIIIGVLQDITEWKSYEQKIEHSAFYDSLTDLPNRRLFEDFFNKASSQAQREAGKIAVLLMDLDGFKKVNDTLGHVAGDIVLQNIGKRMLASIRNGDMVARIGGDEFIAYLAQLNSEQEAVLVARRILAECNLPICIGQEEAGVGVSIGISFCPDDSVDLENLIKKADAAMYHSKATGKNRISIYSEIQE